MNVSRIALQQIRNEGQARVWWGDTPLDLFFNTHGFHAIAAARAREVPFMGHRIPVLDCTTVAVFKVFFNRTKDWADLEAMFEAGRLDVDVVAAFVRDLPGEHDLRIGRLQELAGRLTCRICQILDIVQKKPGNLHTCLWTRSHSFASTMSSHRTARRHSASRSHHPHSTADDVTESVKTEIGAISRQAVYDSLGVPSTRASSAASSPPAPARYEDRVADNHHHLVCRGCHSLVDVDCAVDYTPCLTPSDSRYAVDEAGSHLLGSPPRLHHTHRQKFTPGGIPCPNRPWTAAKANAPSCTTARPATANGGPRPST